MKKRKLNLAQKARQLIADFEKANPEAAQQLKRAVNEITLPEAGHIKYYVFCERFMIYTAIGADNLHHASNKATKLFGPAWSQIRTDQSFDRAYQFKATKDFRELLRSLQN